MSLKIQTLSGYFHEYQKSVIEPDTFWDRIAETFHWRKRWDKTIEWNFKEPSIKWFLNGKLNITENMLDRYLFTAGDRTAIIWEPNDPNEQSRHISYLYRRVYRTDLDFICSCQLPQSLSCLFSIAFNG